MLSAKEILALLPEILTLSKRSRSISISSLIFLISLPLFNRPGIAQPMNGKPELKFQRIHEGLISNRVSAIHQDWMGFMWIGTYSGLHRYDGINFKVYTTSSDSTSISDNYIGDIYEDVHKNLWIGTGNGLVRYNRNADNFKRFTLSGSVPVESGESVLVNTILEDNDHTLWVSAGSAGLYYFDPEEQQFVLIQDTKNLTVTSVTVDRDNIIWFSTAGKGLGRFNTSTGDITFYRHDPENSHSVSSSSIEQVLVDRNGNLWIGTRNAGLDRLALSTNEEGFFHHYRHDPGDPHSLGNDHIFTMYLDNSDNLWVGNENGGLHLYNKKSDSFYRYESDPRDATSLTHNSIWTIYQDSHGRYWIGTAQSGINIADPYHSKFTHYFKNSLIPNSLNNNIIRDLWVDDDNNIWIATDGGGLNYFNRANDTFKAYIHDPDDPNSLGADAVIALNEDEQGNLWVGTWGGGLSILTNKQNGTFTSFKSRIDNDFYPIQNVFDVLFDTPYIWISAFNEGLYRYHTISGKLELFSYSRDNSSGLSSNFVLRLHEDSLGNIWIATLEGLNLLKARHKERGIFQQFLHSDQDSTTLAGNSIRQVFEDRNKNIWIATDAGLSRYVKETEEFENYYHSDGLPTSEIRSVIEDDNGYLWIGTIKGLSRFDPVNKTFTNYDKSDGLQSDEFSRYSVHKTKSGELLFGGLSGFNIFDPEKIQNNPHPPPVYLTDLKLFNKSVDIDDPQSPLKKHISVTDTLVLSYEQSVITFDFVALNYTRPEYNRYAYMIEGFEEDWNYVDTQRNATYTNLNPGTYNFRVKASNSDGIWNEEGTSLTLIITPPFWQTTWFSLLTVFVITGSIFSFYWLRVQSIREQNHWLEQQVAERTRELEEKNTDLQRALQELETTRDELLEKARKAGMADIAAGVLHNVGNILTSVTTSAALIEETAKQSKMKGFIQANTILRENINRIEEFIAGNPNGKHLMEYYLKLEDPLKKDWTKILYQSVRLIEKVELIKEAIAAQQSYARTGLYTEKVFLSDVIENALALQSGSNERHELTIEKDIKVSAPVKAHRSGLIHVLVNILKNAKEVMNDIPPEKKKVSIKTWENEGRAYLSVTDNGPGIKQEDLGKIFTRGFTTKKDGHGFGLYSSANYMIKMGGTIKVLSKGEGIGATFTISLPMFPEA